MSKITFRADDDLVERLERLDVSKSEAMREALRAYLAADGPAGGRQTERDPAAERTGAVDDVIRERVDELLADRLAELGLESPADRHGPHVHERYRGETGDVTISVSVPQPTRRSLEDDRRAADRRTRLEQRDVDGADTHARVDDRESDTGHAEHEPSDETTARCGQCGEHVDDDHVYCPNCGEKASRRLFCDCGDEIRSDWSFCPSCGRRTPAAGVLGRDGPT